MSNQFPQPDYPSNQPPYQSSYPAQGSYPAPPPAGPYQQPQPHYGQQSAPYPYVPGYAPNGVMPAAKLSKLAEASLGLAILGLCTGIASIGAVICGHLALSEIKKPNTLLRGREVAIAGLILGYLEIAAYLILIVVVAASNVHK